jgi:hypothetical protein
MMTFSIDTKDIDLEKFNTDYDIALSGIFDLQYGSLSPSRRKDFQQAISYIKQTFATVIDNRRKNKPDGSVLDACDILLTAEDPQTGQPFTNEAVKYSSIYCNFIQGH